MGEPTFTPGPWAYRPHEFDDWGVVKAGKFTICQARDERQIDQDALSLHRKAGTDPWEANARLIAAAPELYRALSAAQAALKSYQYGNSSTELASEIAAFADKALAKAEGRS